jgi:predicted Rossmann fold nucleotide-binding protein DprA/Smf involved in DNA uptake
MTSRDINERTILDKVLGAITRSSTGVQSTNALAFCLTTRGVKLYPVLVELEKQGKIRHVDGGWAKP